MRQLAAYVVVVMALPDPRPARFSFTYRLRDGQWLIADHHSSSVPAAPR